MIKPTQHRDRPLPGTLLLPQFHIGDKGEPFIIAIEGPDGSGKSTLVRGISRHTGIPHCMGIPDDWMTQQLKRRICIEPKCWYIAALMFLAGCLEQTRQIIEDGTKFMLMDRSIWSTFARVDAMDIGHSEESIRLSILIAVTRPLAPLITIPNLTIILESNYENCRRRMMMKDALAQLIDRQVASQAAHIREVHFYEKLRKQPGVGKFILVKVDGLTTEEVFLKVKPYLAFTGV